MAMTTNKRVAMGGFWTGVKVAGVSIVGGGEERSGATGSVIISGSVGVGLAGIGNDPALSLGIIFYYSKEITVFLGEKIDLKIGR